MLVTRAQGQSSELAQQIENEGGRAILMPVLEIAPPLEPQPLQQALADISSYDWIVFTSRNAVLALAEAHVHERTSLAAVGPATAAELTRMGLQVDYVPPESCSDAMSEHIPVKSGDRVLLPQGDLARPELARRLQERGAIVHPVQAYRTLANALAELPERRPDLISFASSSAVLATHERLCAAGRLEWLHGVPLVVIGPTTADTVLGLGLRVAGQAETSSIPALVRALVRCWEERHV